MRSDDILKAATKRLVNPGYWGLLILMGALWSLLSLAMGLGLPPLRIALSPFYWGLVILVVFPIPWQWSGDDRPLPSFARGLIQAIIWDSIWVLLVLNLVLALHARWEGIHSHGFAGAFQLLPFSRKPGPNPLLSGFVVLTTGLLVGLLMAWKERAEDGEKRANDAATLARMHVLQSQMNPHVLFNVISGLCEMAREQPEAMERTLLDLAAFLRELLDYSARNRAPLGRERAMVECYLGLEQIRLGKRLHFTWDWDSALEALELPPLLLQPLVENAIKHGIAPHRSGGQLRIRLAGTPEAFTLEVANTGAGLATPHQGEGIGLRNARERLAYFQPTATLSLMQDGDWTRATLHMGRTS